MSYYSLPSLFSGISFLALSLYLLYHNLKRIQSLFTWLFFLATMLITFYSFSIFISKNLFDPVRAYLWIRGAYLVMIYILPVLLVALFYFIFNQYPNAWYLAGFLAEIPLFHFFLSSGRLFQGVERTFYGFRELRGEYYPLFLVLLFLFELIVIILFFLVSERSKTP